MPFLGYVLKLLGPAGCAALLFAAAAGVQSMRLHHAKADLAPWQASARAWVKYGHAEKAAFDQDAAYRRQERAQAVQAVNDAAEACTARVARARASAAAIHAIVTKEPRYDANRCPVRELVPTGELRDAVQPRGR